MNKCSPHPLLRSLRRKLGLSIKEVANMLDMYPHTLSWMELGKRPCGELNSRRLAEFYGVDWKILLNIKESKNE